MVWLNNPTESPMKLAPHWKGPYRVIQVLGSHGERRFTYQIENPLDSDDQEQVVHYDRLRWYPLPVAPAGGACFFPRLCSSCYTDGAR